LFWRNLLDCIILAHIWQQGFSALAWVKVWHICWGTGLLLGGWHCHIRFYSNQTGEGSRTVMAKLTHLNDKGGVHMVDVGAKPVTVRQAQAVGRVRMTAQTLRMALEGDGKKGSVRTAAELAGIMAAKRTAELIPLCHQIALSSVTLDIAADKAGPALVVTALVQTNSQTGVEMEALTAVSVACLTIYDMLKAMDRTMVIGAITLLEKRGGASGHYVRARVP
jgi:cyclic pyranopterin phosphate synthase